MDNSKHTFIQKEYDKYDAHIDDDDEDISDVDDDEEEGIAAPYLLSNLSVLEMLQPRVQQRQRIATAVASDSITTSACTGTVRLATTTATATSSNLATATLDNQPTTTTTTSGTAPTRQRRVRRRQNNKLLRHRNWIENEVVHYIQQTAAMEFHSTSNIVPLQTILRRKRRKRGVLPPPPQQQEEASATTSIKFESVNTMVSKDESTMNMMIGYHLTEAEVMQILNHSPKELVDLHLVIDQIHDRFTAQEQEELLRLIHQYRTVQSPLQTETTLITTTINDAARAGLPQRQQKQLLPSLLAVDHSTINNHDIGYHDVTNSSNGNKAVAVVAIRNRFQQEPPSPEDEEYNRFHSRNDRNPNDAVTTSKEASLCTTHVKVEMDNLDDRKPAAI